MHTYEAHTDQVNVRYFLLSEKGARKAFLSRFVQVSRSGGTRWGKSSGKVFALLINVVIEGRDSLGTG
jgi:hypothetical protein